MGKKSWMEIFKSLPKRQPKGDPRNIERVLAFTKLCNEANKGGDDMDECFKKCGFCGKEWDSLRTLVIDTELYYSGFTEYEGKVLFYFDHGRCKSTIALSAEKLDQYFKFTNELYSKKPMT